MQFSRVNTVVFFCRTAFVVSMIFVFSGCVNVFSKQDEKSVEQITSVRYASGTYVAAYVRESQVCTQEVSEDEAAVIGEPVCFSLNNGEPIAVHWLNKETLIIEAQLADEYIEIQRYSLPNTTTDSLIRLRNKPHWLQVSGTEEYIAYDINGSVYILDLTDKQAERVSERVKSFTWLPTKNTYAYVLSDNTLWLHDASFVSEPEYIDIGEVFGVAATGVHSLLIAQNIEGYIQLRQYSLTQEVATRISNWQKSSNAYTRQLTVQLAVSLDRSHVAVYMDDTVDVLSVTSSQDTVVDTIEDVVSFAAVDDNNLYVTQTIGRDAIPEIVIYDIQNQRITKLPSPDTIRIHID